MTDPLSEFRLDGDVAVVNWNKVVAVNMTGVFLCARARRRAT